MPRLGQAQKNGHRFLWIPLKSGVGRLIVLKTPVSEPEFLIFTGFREHGFKAVPLRTIKKMSYILGKKLKMTQIWKDGKIVPVTVVHAEPNKVAILRTKERDGYCREHHLEYDRARTKHVEETDPEDADRVGCRP